MTTSGTYTFSVTRDQIIRQALLKIQAIDPEETPDAVDVSDCAFELNMIAKQWQGRADRGTGLKVWTRRRGSLFLQFAGYKYTVGPGCTTGWTTAVPASTTTTAGSAAGGSTVTLASVTGIASGYSIGIQLASGAMQWTTVSGAPAGLVVTLAATLTGAVSAGAQVYGYQTTGTQPINLEAAILRDSFGNDTPLKVMQQQEYDSLAAKTNPDNVSDPGGIYLEYQLTNSYLFTDVAGCSDVTKYMVLTYLEAIQDFNNPNDTPEYPQEYYLALVWELAKQIKPMYPGAQWTADMQDTYMQAVAIAKKKDPEVSVSFFQPGDD